jgi:CubicO group peptidase (beta-lactamase class C family)
VRRTLAALAAIGMALSPVAANAGAADSLSLSRAGASMSGFTSLFQAAAEDDDDDGGSTAVILGVILVVLIGAAAISGNGGGAASP